MVVKFWTKILFSNIFFTSEKSWQDVSVNLPENIPTATEKMTQKSSIYLLEMSSHVFNFISETSQHPWMKVLINEKFFPNELNLLL